METDLARESWPLQAACRWCCYLLLWVFASLACALSAWHPAVAIAGGLAACLLAAALPLMFATLFEAAHNRQGRQDMPVICCPWFGGCTLLLGAFLLTQASHLVVTSMSTANLESAQQLCEKYAGVRRPLLPRTVCLRRAFIKTEWEAGKLRCQEAEDGHVACFSEFVAAPLFDDESFAEKGMADAIWAWAVTRGRKVDANYRPDGTLCGYLRSNDFEFYLGDYRLAVERVINKHKLQLTEHVEEVQVHSMGGASAASWMKVPLEDRPLLLAADPLESTCQEQALLLAAAIILCLCPCAGPVPLGAILAFWCWARLDKYSGRHTVPDGDDRLE